jgi:hypothetical protein
VFMRVTQKKKSWSEFGVRDRANEVQFCKALKMPILSAFHSPCRGRIYSHVK